MKCGAECVSAQQPPLAATADDELPVRHRRRGRLDEKPTEAAERPYTRHDTSRGRCLVRCGWIVPWIQPESITNLRPPCLGRFDRGEYERLRKLVRGGDRALTKVCHAGTPCSDLSEREEHGAIRALSPEAS